jgi:EAL domain-containing protein (putative c-di-GMP-specific phosphodiesterase class I)
MAVLSTTMGFEIVAEGIETIEEYTAVRACGIHLMQGYLLAKPAFEALPGFSLPASNGTADVFPSPALYRKNAVSLQLGNEPVIIGS